MPTRWTPAIARLLLVVVFVWMAVRYIPPVLFGAVMAIVLHPLHRRIAPRLGPRRAAFGLTIAVVVAAVVPLAILALNASLALTRFLTEDWPATAASIRAYLEGGPLASLGLDGDQISSAANSLVTTVAGGIAGIASAMLAAVPGQIIALFLFCAAFYYFISDAARVTTWLAQASPFTPDETADLFETVRRSARGVVIGVLATAVVQGSLTTLALLLLGVPAAFALGVIAGMLSLIPLLGTTPVTLGAVIYLASIGQMPAAAGMLVAAVLIGVSDNLLRPMLMHVATPQQHPLVILIGVFGGVAAFGGIGVFLGPILAALAAWAVLTSAKNAQAGIAIQR